MPIIGPITVTTAGVAGSAVGSADLPYKLDPCLLEAVKIDYHASAPVTTDVTISEVQGLGRNLLVVSNNATDGTYYPRHTTHDPVAADAGNKTPYVIEGTIRVSVAQADALTGAVQVWLQTVDNVEVT
jgi:hypothetical protein